ncbi:MAG: uncharacterized protein JWP68_1544 [Modestobacter sp.]|nr:uncharacterized protein [Modestobacter sp.]
MTVSQPSAVEIGLMSGRAGYVLRANDRGAFTVASPTLYPHMWSWDAGFVALGIATVSVPRALDELRSLLSGQWATGMIPHILFHEPSDYFPGPERWRTQVAAARPAGVLTSGICQPPIHVIALSRILHDARRRGGADQELAEEFVRETFDQWLAWHSYLATARDPYNYGLVEIHHGWESGMDDSPRWDEPYANVAPQPDMPPFVRADLAHVADPSQRPTDVEYARYLWLLEQKVRARYDDAVYRSTGDFVVGDVLVSALLAAASDLLADMGEELGIGGGAAGGVEQSRAIARRFRTGVLRSVNPETGLARDLDLRTGRWLEVESAAGFAPLLCGGDDALTRRQRDLLLGPRWCGHSRLRWPVVPSVSPASPAFREQTYWRGPQWPVLNWLMAWALNRSGEPEAANQLRLAGLSQLVDCDFAEYYQPMTGQTLGSRDQSWTAAIALDFLAARRPAQRRPVRWLTSELPRITPAQRAANAHAVPAHHPGHQAGERPPHGRGPSTKPDNRIV